jgi:hypothetical protein
LLPEPISRVRLRASTPPFHGGNTGSNPVRGTSKHKNPCRYGLGEGFVFSDEQVAKIVAAEELVSVMRLHRLRYVRVFPCDFQLKNF